VQRNSEAVGGSDTTEDGDAPRGSLTLLLGMVVLQGCSESSVDLEQTNIEVVRRWHDEVWSRGDLDVIDEIVAEDYVKHWAAFPATVGREALEAHVAQWRRSFPDWREDVDAIEASGDMVFVRWTESGTFSVDLPFHGATNRRGEVAGMGWLRLQDGQIVEEWTMLDDWGFQMQVGLTYPKEGYKPGWDR
jgi:steroid delta-isomerase-like uncharacterized protein